MSIRSMTAALALAGLLWPSVSSGAAHDPGLLVVLSKIHGDPTPEELAAFGPSLDDALRAIAEDPAAPRLARLRALASLARQGQAFELAAQLATDPAAAMRLRLGAVWCLGVHFAERPEAVDHLAAVLADEDAGLRAAVVEALARIGTQAAHLRLDSHRIGERHVLVRDTLRKVEAARLGVEPRALPPEGRMPRPLFAPEVER